jgi:hypothetical protein
MSQQQSPDRERQGSKPRTEIPDAPTPPAQNEFWKNALDDAAFNGAQAQWARTAGSASLYAGKMDTSEWMEASRIVRLSERGMLKATNWALGKAWSHLPKDEVLRLYDLQRGPYEELIRAASQHPALSKQKKTWQRIAEIHAHYREKAIREALKNPGFSLRALVRHRYDWTFRQPRIMEILGRLVWYTHHGNKSEARLAGDWLKLLLLQKKVGGGSLDRGPATVSKWCESELARVNVVLSNENRILIRADWQEVKQIKNPRVYWPVEPHWTTKKPKLASRPATADDMVEEALRRHQHRCKVWVELDDIYCVIDHEHQSHHAYVVERAAAAFQTTTSDIEKKLKRAKHASAV